MRDMSNRDKTILIVITIIIILVAGFFALIRPQYNKYSADIDTYNTTKAEYDGIKQKLDAIPGLKDSINEIYVDADKTAKIFVNDAFAYSQKNYSHEKTSMSLDQHIQPAIDEANLNVEKLEMDGVEATSLEYYYYAPSVVTYSLIEAADINGNYAADIAELLQTSVILEEREVAEVLATTMSLSVTGTKENLMTFLDQIKADKNAILVNSIKISDYMFIGGLEEEEEGQPEQPVQQEPQFDEEGNPIEQPEPEVPSTPIRTDNNVVTIEGEGYSQMEMDVVFYSAKPVDKPEFGD